MILNYGMETGFFRYANKEPDPERVYTTSLISVGFTSLLFMVLVSVLIGPVSGALLLPGHPLFVWLLGITVAIDAFSNIPFAYLRYRNRAFRFAGIKLLNVGLNISLNLFFLLRMSGLDEVGRPHWCPGSMNRSEEPVSESDGYFWRISSHRRWCFSV